MNYPTKISKVIIVILGIVIFLYSGIRAYLLSITWDEAFSYTEFIRNKIVFITHYNVMSANNHFLNTFLDIYFIKWFGISEFVLRLPSLLSLILFLFYTAKLVNGFQNKFLAIASFLILSLNPYVLDFFCLSRGYGLSLGLMMASVYYLYSFHLFQNKSFYAFVSLFFAGLAALAQFVLLNYLVVLFSVLIFLLLRNILKSNQTRTKKTIQFCLDLFFCSVIFIFFIGIIVPIGLKLKESGSLFYGGENNFWTDTIHSIVDKSFYDLGYNYWFQRVAKVFAIITLLFTAFFILSTFIKKQFTDSVLFLTSLLFLIILCALSTIVQHYVFGTPYLIDRTVLFLVVLFNLIVVFFINEIAKKKSKMAVFIYLYAISTLFHFSRTINFTYVNEWKPDAETKEMLADLEKIKIIPSEKNNIRIGIPLAFESSINFYRDIKNLTWLNKADRDETTNMLNDYFYLEPQQFSLINKDSIEVIKEYPLTKNILAKRKFSSLKIKTCLNKKVNLENSPQKIDSAIEFSKSISYFVNDSLTPLKNSIVTVKAIVSAKKLDLKNMSLIISFQNKNGTYLWKNLFVKDYLKKTDEWTDLYFTCIVPNETKVGDEVATYIWNQDKKELSLKELELKWIVY